MPKKKFTVYFVRPTNEDGHKFGDCLKRIHGLKVAERSLETTDGPVRIHLIEQRIEMPTVWEGDVMRTRLHEPGTVSKRDGTVRQVITDPEEGMGEVSAFCYDSESNILIYQANRASASVDRFGSYVAKMSQLKNTFTMPLVLRPDAVTKYESFTSFRTLEFALARPSDLKAFASEVSSVAGAVKLSEDLGAPKIAVKISTERSGSLRAGPLRKLVDQLRAFMADETKGVDKLLVRGVDPETGLIDPVDLIESVFRAKITVEGTSLIEQFYIRRKEALRKLFDEHVVSLRKVYGQRHESGLQDHPLD